jgi:hypothetical protein
MMPSQSYACSKNSTKTEQSSCSKEKSKNQNIKKVARANPVKNAKVTNAGAVVHTALAGAVLQPLP